MAGFAPRPIDPLGFGQLEEPAPVKVVDRQAHLREQLEQREFQRQQREAAQQAEAQRRAELERALTSDEFQQKLTGAIQATSAYAEQERDRMIVERRRQQEREAIGRLHPLLREEAERQIAETGTFDIQRSLASERGIGAPVGDAIYKGLTADIPFRDRAVDFVGKGIITAAMGSSGRQLDTDSEVGEDIAEVVVPREVWELALEFMPGVGTVPDLQRAFKAGAPGAVRAVNAARKMGARALANEAGQTTPSTALGGVPDAVKAIIAKRRGRNVPVKTEDELQAAWEVLPPENRKLVTTLAETIIDPRERAARLAASRGQKAANIGDIFESDAPAGEKLSQAFGARRGADLPAQEPLAPRFTDDEIDSYQRQIVDAARTGQLSNHEAANLGSAFDLLMTGARKNGTTNPIMPHEAKMFGRVFGPEFEAALPRVPEELTRWQKLLAPFQIWRSAKTAFDVGTMFRQGRKVIFSDPIEWAKAARGQFRALGQQGYERVMEQVHSAKHYTLGQTLGRKLGILEQGSGLSDEFLSPATAPGSNRVLNALKSPLSASERVYNAFLNILRQSIFDKNVDELIKSFGGDINKVPIEEIQRVADNINTATMFGNISKLGDWQKAMSQTLFSARGLVSSPQFYGDFVRALGPNASPAARKIIVQRTVSAIASDLAILGGVAYLGAVMKQSGMPNAPTVELDRFSQSLGDVRIGPVKWNPWGADAPFVRAAIQAGFGKKTPEGGETEDINFFDRTKGFARTKLSPMASIIYDLWLNDQRDFRGRDIKDRAFEYAIEQASPIMGYSMYEGFREEGLWALAELGTGVGLDVQVYGPSETVKKANAKSEFTDKLNSAGFPRAEVAFKDDYWQGAFKDTFGDISEYDTISDLKSAYVDHWAPQLPSFESKGEAEARDEAGRGFEEIPIVQTFKEGEKAARLQWMRDNRTLAREAAKEGEFGVLSEEEEEALGLR